MPPPTTLAWPATKCSQDRVSPQQFIITPTGTKYSKREVIGLLKVFLQFTNDDGEVDNAAAHRAMIRSAARGEKKAPVSYCALVRALDVDGSGAASFLEVLQRCFPLATPAELKIMHSWAYPEDTDNGLLMLSDEQIAELQAKIAAHEETLQPRSSRDNWRARGPRSKDEPAPGLHRSCSGGNISTPFMTTGARVYRSTLSGTDADAMDMSGSCSVQQHSSDGRLGSSWASFVQRNRASLTWPQGQGMPASQPQSPTSHSDNSHSLSPMAARQMPSSARCLLVQMMEAPGQMARRAPWPTQGQRLPLGMKHETFLSALDRAASLDASASGCASPRLNPGAATCPEQQAAAGPSTRQRFVAQLTINTSCTAAQPSTALRMGSGDSASCPCSPATKHEPGQLTAQQDGDAAGAASAAIAKLHKMQQSLGREMQSMRERFYSTSGVAKVAPNSLRLETPTATSRLRRQPSYSPPYSRSGTLQVIRQHSSPLAVALRPEGGLQ